MKPSPITIKRLGKNDVATARKLIALFDEVFKEKPKRPATESYLKVLLNDTNFIAFAATAGNNVAGGLTAYRLPMLSSARPEIFIYDVAVKQKYQRTGIGKKLLTAIAEYGKQNEVSEIFVAAHEADKHALKFYKALGGKAEKVKLFLFDA